MSQKLTVHIEVIIPDAERSNYKGLVDAIPDLIKMDIRPRRDDVSVTVVDAITSDVESEYALSEQ